MAARQSGRRKLSRIIYRNVSSRENYPKTGLKRTSHAVIKATLDEAGFGTDPQSRILRKQITSIMLSEPFTRKGDPKAERLYYQVLGIVTSAKGDAGREKFIEALQKNLQTMRTAKEQARGRN